MNIRTMQIAKRTSEVEPKYQEKDAWYAEVILPDSKIIRLEEKNGLLQVQSPSGRLIIYPDASNSIYIQVVR